MKERGILYTPDNIRAVRDRRKWQTRRIISPQPERIQEGCYDWYQRDKRLRWNQFTDAEFVARCPYGVVGDRLYVKEGFYAESDTTVHYRLDGWQYEDGAGKGWTSALFMPKKYARLWLEITDVRVERLQDISEADAIAEGIPLATVDIAVVGKHLVKGNLSIDRYARLWDSINEKDGHGWAVNEWVWVLTFKVIEP